MKKKKILIVEDDEGIMMGLEENLKFEGYEVIKAVNGEEGLKLGLSAKADLVLMDIMLPIMSGYEVCRKMRDAGKGMPIIMLTARDEEFDKLHGFEMGADDYVTKPFSIKELLARITVALARGGSSSNGPKQYEFGDCILDMEARILRRQKANSKGKGRKQGDRGQKTEDGGRGTEEWYEITLTHTEFDLLAYFCANEGKALSRDQVMNDVWGTEYYGTQRSLDSFVANLRSKIEKKASNPEHILTVHGVGYKFAS